MLHLLWRGKQFSLLFCLIFLSIVFSIPPFPPIFVSGFDILGIICFGFGLLKRCAKKEIMGFFLTRIIPPFLSFETGLLLWRTFIACWWALVSLVLGEEVRGGFAECWQARWAIIRQLGVQKGCKQQRFSCRKQGIVAVVVVELAGGWISCSVCRLKKLIPGLVSFDFGCDLLFFSSPFPLTRLAYHIILKSEAELRCLPLLVVAVHGSGVLGVGSII